MTYSPFPERVVDTPYGKLSAWATSADHVGFRTEHAHNNRTGQDVAEFVTLSRVRYSLRLDFARTSTFEGNYPKNGGWGREELDDDTWSLSREGFVHSLRRFETFSLDYGTPAANRELREKLIPHLLAWLHSEDGRKLIDTAKRRAAQERLESLRTESAKLREQLADAERRLAEAEGER